jgi:hypothetical protein
MSNFLEKRLPHALTFHNNVSFVVEDVIKGAVVTCRSSLKWAAEGRALFCRAALSHPGWHTEKIMVKLFTLLVFIPGPANSQKEMN